METAELIAQLAIRHHAKTAYRQLFSMGFEVVPVAREGLHHENASVRYYCCSLLDHFLVSEALEDVVSMVHDPDPKVRVMALHTLACDRCKEGDCRPAEAEVLPTALQILNDDGDAHVRAMAVEVVGQYVHTNPIAERALVETNKDDSSPTVRKKAGWYAPGGPIYKRRLPKRLK
jgi:HEAT repeat protein